MLILYLEYLGFLLSQDYFILRLNSYQLLICSIQESLLDILTGAFLSIGFITNFLSLKEMFLISLQGNPIFGVSLERRKTCFKR